MHTNFPAGGIITGGLGLPACNGFAITTQFNLFCGIVITVTPTVSSSGGSRPLAPGEIHNMYKPVNPEYLIPYDNIQAKNRQYVQIVLTLNDNTTNKEYIVSDKNFKRVIKIINLLNTTRSKIKTAITKLKRITSRVIVKAQNLRKARRRP